MSYLSFRIWFLVTVALALAGVIIRLVWELTTIKSVGSLLVIALAVLAILGLYVLLAYFTLKPNLKKLKSRPVRIWISAVATAALISTIIHFIRFVPSPEAAAPLSVIIAVIFLLAGISGYLLLLWLIWSIWKAREG